VSDAVQGREAAAQRAAAERRRASAADGAARVRGSAGWFDLPDRGVIRVRGADRVRWTNGMVSNDVARLAPGPASSGCHALLLTPQGRILADLHVFAREDELWLELAGEALPDVLARLERYVIADDVALADASAAWRRFALEGPGAPALLSSAAGGPVEVAPDSGVELRIAGAGVVACAWGWSGEAAYQIFAPAEAADAVARAFAVAGGADLVSGDAEVLEVLRIEAGTPRQGAELGPDVLPAETGLVGRAVSLAKGCYTGQEIVARMASRGAASHRLVGLRFAEPGADLPAPGAPVAAANEVVGSVTSACRSDLVGAIALAYVRTAHAEPGSEVEAGARARVTALPFVQGREAAAQRGEAERSGGPREGLR
jgi:folate-binding protein YgfZ